MEGSPVWANRRPMTRWPSCPSFRETRLEGREEEARHHAALDQLRLTPRHPRPQPSPKHPACLPAGLSSAQVLPEPSGGWAWALPEPLSPRGSRVSVPPTPRPQSWLRVQARAHSEGHTEEASRNLGGNGGIWTGHQSWWRTTAVPGPRAVLASPQTWPQTTHTCSLQAGAGAAAGIRTRAPGEGPPRLARLLLVASILASAHVCPIVRWPVLLSVPTFPSCKDRSLARAQPNPPCCIFT